MFGKRLHSYLIKDAIHDENVLQFCIDYVGTMKSHVKMDIDVEAIDEKEVMALASIPGREQLMAQLLFVLNAPVSGLARAIKAIAEKE